MRKCVIVEQKNTYGQQTSVLVAQWLLQPWFQHFSVQCSSNSGAMLMVMFQHWPIHVPKQQQNHFTCKGLGFKFSVFGDMGCFHSIHCHSEQGSQRTNVLLLVTIHSNWTSSSSLSLYKKPSDIHKCVYLCSQSFFIIKSCPPTLKSVHPFIHIFLCHAVYNILH